MWRTVRSPHRGSTIRDTEDRALRVGPRSGPAQPHRTSPPAVIIGGSRLSAPNDALSALSAPKASFGALSDGHVATQNV
jgi:hypothetical protein